jgi:hypothetical protein
MSALGAEIATITLSYTTRAFVIEISFIFLVGVTVVAMVSFLFEAVPLRRKIGNKPTKDNSGKNEEESSEFSD